MSFSFGTPQQTTQANTGFSFSSTPAVGTPGTVGFSLGQNATSTPAANTIGFGATYAIFKMFFFFISNK